MSDKRGRGSVYLRGRVWWLTYYVDGERVQESSRTRNRREAEALLALRRRELREGTWRPPSRAEAGGGRGPTVAVYLERWIARRERAGVRNVRDEARWMRSHVIPAIGELRLRDVTRPDVRAIVETVTELRSARTKRPYSPRTILHIYRTMSLAFADAVRDKLIAESPCTLEQRRGELPAKRDADARWRVEAVYSEAEAETLLGAPEIPLERRVLYGLMLLAGLRGSEATGRCWRDYDPKAKPLGRLVVATQADGAKGERPTKTGDVREVPVVPALAALLAEWRLYFPVRFGSQPRPDDPIVPGPRGKPGALTFRGATTVYMGLGRDLDALGLRRVPALRHSMRATFLTLLESDGANMAIARRATHRPPSDVVAGYIRTSWADLCREVGRLRLAPRRGAEVVRLPVAVGQRDGDNRGDSPDPNEERPPENQGPRAPDAGLEPPALSGNVGKTRAGASPGRVGGPPEIPRFAGSARGPMQTGTNVPEDHVATLRRILERTTDEAERAALDAAISALG